MLGWIAKREIGRIDRIEAAMRGKVDRDEMHRITQRIFDKLDEHTRESRVSMDKLHAKLDASIAEQSKINLEVARNLGRD